MIQLLIGGSLLILIPCFGLWLFKRLHILEHKKWAAYYKREPVPNAQGIWLWLTLALLIIVFGRKHINNHHIWIYIGAISVLGTISTIDLFRPIPSRIRLVLQLSIFGGIVVWGGVAIDTIRFIDGNISFGSLMMITISILWFALCTNAINRFDGIQGQASGVTAIGALSIWAVVNFIVLPSYHTLTPAIQSQLEIVKIIALALGAVSIVYTYIEYKPLGLIRDIGTTLFGFSLAYLSLLGGAKVGTLIVTLSLVIFDAVWVVTNRLFVLKKNPMKGDYTHLHHRLIANGRTRSEVRWFVWIWSIVLSVLMILQDTNTLNKWIILGMMACLFFGINIYLFRYKQCPTTMKVDFTTEEVEKHA